MVVAEVDGEQEKIVNYKNMYGLLSTPFFPRKGGGSNYKLIFWGKYEKGKNKKEKNLKENN